MPRLVATFFEGIFFDFYSSFEPQGRKLKCHVKLDLGTKELNQTNPPKDFPKYTHAYRRLICSTAKDIDDESDYHKSFQIANPVAGFPNPTTFIIGLSWKFILAIHQPSPLFF